MQEIEIPPRDSFKYYVKVQDAPKTIMWNFSTRKKNINFGLFYQKEDENSILQSSLNDSRSPFNTGIRNQNGAESSPASKKKSLLSFSSSKKDSQDTLDLAASDASSINSVRKRNKSQTINLLEPNFEELLPIQRYESSKAAVKGQYQVTKKGVYVLYFGQSLTIAKLVESSLKPDLEGWLLKKKRKKMQGWAKRYCVCDKGQLAYYKFPGGFCRGSIPITYSTISVDPELWIINIDSGTTIWHLRAMNKEDYELWINSIKQFKAITAGTLKTDVENRENLQMSPNLDMDEAVRAALERISQSVETVSNLLQEEKGQRRRSISDEHPLSIQMVRLKELLAKEKQEILDQLECEVRKSQTLKTAYQAILSENNELKAKLGLERAPAPISGVRIPERSRVAETENQIKSAISETFFDAEEIVLSGAESSDADKMKGENKEMVIFERSEEAGYDDDDDEDDDSDFSEYGRGTKDYEMTTAALARASLTPSMHRVLKKAASEHKGPVRRKVLPAKMIEDDVSLISILRKNVGKDLSTVTMPISLNEPLNLLQKMAEDLEYSDLLDRAAEKSDPLEKIVHVSAFAVSGYASSLNRCIRKPFNPLQNETYECVRPDRNFKYLSEKVSHNPPIMACHAISPHWVFFQDSRVKSKFWGKSMEFIPSGKVNVLFPNSGDHFSWTKVTTCMRNIIGGTRSLDHYGKMCITNKKSKLRAEIVFKENSSGWLGGETSINEIAGAFFDADNTKLGFLRGKWCESLYFIPANNPDATEAIWQANPPLENQAEMYGFTQFALELNEITEDIRPYIPITDTRWRPDQRLYEEGNLSEAEKTKIRLEEKQRAKRKQLEAEGASLKPRWFALKEGEDSLDGEWIYQGGYWEAREQKNWGEMPDLW